MNKPSKHPVTLEDLIRLKRAERPPAEFWTRFDSELRQKQLAALVEKRPWWRSLPRTLRSLGRYPLPLGAAAVLAVTLVSLREYQPAIPASTNTLVETDRVHERIAAVTAEASDATVAPEEQDNSAATEIAAPVVANQAKAESQAITPDNLAPTIAGLPVSQEDQVAELRPSARSIAENRAAAEALLGAPSSNLELHAMPVRLQPQEPLAQITNPAEKRRNRFANAFAAAAVGTSPVPTARVAKRLSDEQLYDSIHRFGASGNSVSFRF